MTQVRWMLTSPLPKGEETAGQGLQAFLAAVKQVQGTILAVGTLPPADPGKEVSTDGEHDVQHPALHGD